MHIQESSYLDTFPILRLSNDCQQPPAHVDSDRKWNKEERDIAAEQCTQLGWGEWGRYDSGIKEVCQRGQEGRCC